MIHIPQRAIDALQTAVGGAVSTYLYREPVPGSVAVSIGAPGIDASTQRVDSTDERAAFEAWFCSIYHDKALQAQEAGCYLNRSAGMAWDAWQARAALAAAPAPALAARQLQDLDNALTETIKDRDCYHEWADRLAGAISKHFGEDIGEHSNVNNPWAVALGVIEESIYSEVYRAMRAAHLAATGDAS